MTQRATQFATRIISAKTTDELRLIGLEIKAESSDLDGWIEWLRTIYESKLKALRYIYSDDHLTKEGKKWIKSSLAPQSTKLP